MTSPKPDKLVAGVDFYMEGDRMVLTAAYLLRRGYCCNSGCRHCPYRDGAPPPDAPKVRILGTGAGKEPPKR